MMAIWRRVGLALAGAIVLTISTIVPTSAAPGDPVISEPDACPGGVCEVRAQKPDTSSSSTNTTSSRVGPSAKEVWLKQVAQIRRYNQQFESYERCLATSSNTCTVPDRNALPELAAWTDLQSDTAAPTLSPSQAGAIAVARLRLPLTPPKVGPDPNLNKWKMAAVGYPLWIWADGPTHVGPVSDSVGSLSVSLDARLAKTVFRMGDGGTVTCAGAGTPYKISVKPGTASPTCGYRYEKPSLPKGTYTVTAISYWAVTWTVNNTSGVITVPVAASAPLPVGEVQTLVR